MKPEPDVCLLLEGTYPFVRGGVSSWVHQLVSALRELTFSLVFIGGCRSDQQEMHYALPDNVVHLETHYLRDAFEDAPGSASRSAMSERLAANCRALHEALQARARRDHQGAASEFVFGRPDAGADQRALERMLDAVLLGSISGRGSSGPQLEQFLYSPQAWALIRDAYLEGDSAAPFVDYFWTLRWMHGPLFQLGRVAAQLPAARAYHALSTGYAGYLGALLERERGRPLILSEHGIYTKERRIDLNHAEWLDRGEPSEDHRSLRGLWIRYFESLGRLAYRSANPIIALYEGNRRRQQQDGAAPERTRVVVNGIDVDQFAEALAQRPRNTPQLIGLVGRVVPIKDIKTFLRALCVVRERLPAARAWIIGGEEEDPAYGQECRALACSLGIQDGVQFLGHRDVRTLLPRLGLLMLTSISEAQPLAILEAFAAGVPCVATDVGACREQIEGRDADDRALGRAGRVVPFANADALAAAAVELLLDPGEWRACQSAGLARVRRYYSQRTMLDAYREIYRDAQGA